MNILHVRLIKLTHFLCVRRVFWRFLLFWPSFATTSLFILLSEKKLTLDPSLLCGRVQSRFHCISLHTIQGAMILDRKLWVKK